MGENDTAIRYFNALAAVTNAETRLTEDALVGLLLFFGELSKIPHFMELLIATWQGGQSEAALRVTAAYARAKGLDS